MQGLVFGIGPRDPLTLGAVCLTLGAVGVAASLGPARRATAVDPVIALRNG
jgi:ABC-type antimicrobial peptide transport system permease subunit